MRPSLAIAVAAVLLPATLLGSRGRTMAAAIAGNALLCTTRECTDFELRLKVELLSGDKANAGVQFRTARDITLTVLKP